MRTIGWGLLAAAVMLTAGCGRTGKKDEMPTRGDAAVLVDETFFPLIEGVVQVFESQYRYANVDILPCPEMEISGLLMKDSVRLALMSRPLTASEQAWFDAKNIVPKVTEVAYDGIAVITGRESRDSIINVDALRAMLRGESCGRMLVFDNPASGTVRYMKEFAETDSLRGAYSMRSSAEVIRYVADNPSAVGFVGVDWLYEADSLRRADISRIRVMAVGDEASGYHRPTQNDMAEGLYPFTRKIYFINVQGTAGLGLGLASFMAGDAGQRIVLKSGLVPVKYPKREIIIRKQL